VSNPNGRKGAKFETDLLAYLRSGGLLAERLPKTGVEDECDLVVSGGLFARSQRFEIIECKNVARIDLPQFLRERDIGVLNYAKHRSLDLAEVGGVVAVKRRNAAIGKSFVVTTVDDYYGITRMRTPEWQ
jgi:Holliday junction resolvase